MKESFNNISWQVTEETYRADPALSYSTLAKYERTGFNDLDHLFDRIETPSLTFGSAVDSLITGGRKEFDERFVVADFPNISDNLIQIAKTLFNVYGQKYSSINEFPDDILADIGEQCGFYANDKYKNYRVKLIKENCPEYYKLLFLATDKTVINSQTYQDILATVDALKTSEATKFYFQEDSPFENIERLYQLKFKTKLNNTWYRCMADLIIIDHDAKTVQPIDLKTSSKKEWDFYKSFIEWRYDIQSRLYWRVIRAIMDESEIFKGYKLLPYQFIVVNRATLTPLVWEFPYTDLKGPIMIGKNKDKELRDPCTIGEELSFYLDTRPKVPVDINTTGVNNLATWLDKL